MNKSASAAFVLVLLVLMTGLYGWVLNVAALIHAGADIAPGLLIARVVGISVPVIGAVLGFF